jgi:hypothetical protein
LCIRSVTNYLAKYINCDAICRKQGPQDTIGAVMAGHSRLKDGVASARLRAAIHVFGSKK